MPAKVPAISSTAKARAVPMPCDGEANRKPAGGVVE